MSNSITSNTDYVFCRNYIYFVLYVLQNDVKMVLQDKKMGFHCFTWRWRNLFINASYLIKVCNSENLLNLHLKVFVCI
jgi:hypothetical protein